MQCVFIRKKNTIIWMVVHPKRRRKGYVTGYLHIITGMDDGEFNRPTRNRKVFSLFCTTKHPLIPTPNLTVYSCWGYGFVNRHQLGNLWHYAAFSSRYDHGD